MGKCINSSYCYNNCKTNHMYYCYLFSFYICKTEQHYKVNTANIHQCKLSFSWQFISWKWEGENKQPTSLEKLEKRSPTDSTVVSEASCLTAFFSPSSWPMLSVVFFSFFFNLIFSQFCVLLCPAVPMCLVYICLDVEFGEVNHLARCQRWKTMTQNTEPAKIYHVHRPQIQMFGNGNGEELSPGSCSCPPLPSLCVRTFLVYGPKYSCVEALLTWATRLVPRLWCSTLLRHENSQHLQEMFGPVLRHSGLLADCAGALKQWQHREVPRGWCTHSGFHVFLH